MTRGTPRRLSAEPGLALLALAFALGARPARAECVYPLTYYGTYSVGTKAGGEEVSLEGRLQELRGLGANLIVATGARADILDLLPDGLLAVPGCGLMQREDWQTDGQWDEAHARARLAQIAPLFANHPRVFGICLTHEVTEYANHSRRRWMYRLAKAYFPNKKVFHFYGVLYDRLNPSRRKVYGYGRRGQVESDILFVNLPATQQGRFSLAQVRRLKETLTNAARTPDIPVWGETSINADTEYVTGPDSMVEVWGQNGENMALWTDALFRTVRRKGPRPLRLTGFFWRSLGRFPYDLGYPAFSAERAQVRAIGESVCIGP